MAVIKIATNAVVAKLIDAPDEIKTFVSEVLSYDVAGAQFSAAFTSGGWDGTSTFFKFRKSVFPSGFYEMVAGKLKARGHKVVRIHKPLPRPLGLERPNVSSFGYTEEYRYQPETVDTLIEKGAMIAQIATGGGKSFVCCIAVARIKRPALFLTTRGALMYQMKATLEESIDYRAKHGEPELRGATVGVIGDGVWSPRKTATVAMVQTLAAKLKDPSPFDSKKKQARQIAIQNATRKLLSMFELVILEEAHESSGDSYFNILNQCKNAHYRLALTATPFMKDAMEDNMRLMACAGSIGIRVSEKELIDKGILAKPYFKYVDSECPKGLKRTTGWQRAYKMGITENLPRNTHVIEECMRMLSHGLTVMILVQHTKHGDLLKAALQSNSVRVQFLRGDVKQTDRQTHLKALGSGDLQVLIGTNVLDVGVDVPSVGSIILAGGGKAETALRQRIGRGLRRKKTGPNVAFIVDFVDKHNSHTRDHAGQRRYIVESTEGFGENILPEGKDFNYNAFK